MSRPYRKIVANYRREYPHQVAVQNFDDWRAKYLSDAHYAATKDRLVLWFEGDRAIYGFKSADQAAAFKAWVDTCGIDWLHVRMASCWQEIMMPVQVSLAVSRMPTSWVVISMTGMAYR
jgi:hypothetical protein